MGEFSSKLGIISCPGGEAFAHSVVNHLTRLFKRDLAQKTNDLVKKYGISREEAVRRFNLDSDLTVRQRVSKGSPDEFLIPRFMVPTEFTRFANGEFKATIQASVRGSDLYIFQDVENHYPLLFPNSGETAVLSVNDHMMCLMTVIDAAVQSGAASITLVLPAYPYSRQHKRKGREALTAAWFARLCEFMGVARILTLDIHSTEIQNSCKTIALENMHASYQIMKKLCGLIRLEDDDFLRVIDGLLDGIALGYSRRRTEHARQGTLSAVDANRHVTRTFQRIIARHGHDIGTAPTAKGTVPFIPSGAFCARLSRWRWMMTCSARIPLILSWPRWWSMIR